MDRIKWLCLAGTVLLAGACNKTPPENTRPLDAPVKVHVVNYHTLPVDIYVIGSGTNHRLGTVHPGMEDEFEVPPTLVGGSPVQFLSRSAAGDAYRSGPILISPGAIVDLVIQRRMFNSTAILRP
jgi:hypothetical protein